MDEVTRIEVEPATPDRTPQEGPVEERSIVAALLSDANTAIAGGAGGLITAAALKVAGKFGGKGGPPDAGQSKGQDPAPPAKAD